MKPFTILIYATLTIYANISLSHERKDFESLQDSLKGSLKNILMHEKTMFRPPITLQKLTSGDEVIEFGQGNVIIINFWATWCVPCREEMPSLNDLVTNVGSDNFSIIAIATGRNSQKSIKKFFEQYNLSNLRSFKDPRGAVASQMSVMGLPTTIIIDQHSNELGRLIGSTDWNSSEAIDFMKLVLKH